jgi:hypothetical protein
VFSRFKFLRTAKTRCTAVVKRCAFFAPKTEPVRLAHNTFTKSARAKINAAPERSPPTSTLMAGEWVMSKKEVFVAIPGLRFT